MDSKEFNLLANGIFSECKAKLISKGQEYAKGKDRLSNFKRAAALEQVDPELALQGMMTKHVVSIYDYIDDLNDGIFALTTDQLEEKIVDNINYLILLWALVNERIGATDAPC